MDNQCLRSQYAWMEYLFWSSKPGNYALRSVVSISCSTHEPAAQTDPFLGSLLSDAGDDVSSPLHLYSRHRFIESTSSCHITMIIFNVGPLLTRIEPIISRRCVNHDVSVLGIEVYFWGPQDTPYPSRSSWSCWILEYNVEVMIQNHWFSSRKRIPTILSYLPMISMKSIIS